MLAKAFLLLSDHKFGGDVSCIFIVQHNSPVLTMRYTLSIFISLCV